uniref:Uncharacterized protein n=1 Tax=Parascaris equorum TaxID=6256 RepID=A0A914RP19_PAREQ
MCVVCVRVCVVMQKKNVFFSITMVMECHVQLKMAKFGYSIKISL